MNNTSRVNVRIRIPVKGRNRSLIEREIMSYFKGTPDVMTVRVRRITHGHEHEKNSCDFD